MPRTPTGQTASARKTDLRIIAQIKAKRNGKLCVRWLRPWKPKTDEEDAALQRALPPSPIKCSSSSLTDGIVTFFRRDRLRANVCTIGIV